MTLCQWETPDLKYSFDSLLDVARKLELVVQEGEEPQSYDFILGETLSPEKATLRFKALNMVATDELSVSLNGTSLDAQLRLVPIEETGMPQQEPFSYAYPGVGNSPRFTPCGARQKHHIVSVAAQGCANCTGTADRTYGQGAPALST